ncbi:unnamed protein product [Orchesella dallaii]|uniref:Uncharacterized protein n=1 Tax=Orchesella dallaii TaxID=48710 RepID=A0ABP1QX45_9HEXA
MENLEKSVGVLTDTVLKIGSLLNLKLDDVTTRRSRSTSRQTSSSRSRSPIYLGQKRQRSHSSSARTPLRRSRSPFSVPRGENTKARKDWTDDVQKLLSKRDDDALIINAPEDPLIKLLGADPGSSQKHGENFHQHLATRWQEIAKTGLPKDERDKIKSKLKPPPNCEFGAPILNAELAKAVIPIVRSRDDELSRVQSNLQISIAGMGHLLSTLLNDKEPIQREKLISDISDTGRFLTGTQYSLSLLRRRIIKDNVKDVAIKELLHETPIYPNLFEADISQKIKQMQSLTKVGNDITKPSGTLPRLDPRTPFKKSDSLRTPTSSKQTLNSFRPLPSYRTKRGRSGRYPRM